MSDPPGVAELAVGESNGNIGGFCLEVPEVDQDLMSLVVFEDTISDHDVNQALIVAIGFQVDASTRSGAPGVRERAGFDQQTINTDDTHSLSMVVTARQVSNRHVFAESTFASSVDVDSVASSVLKPHHAAFASVRRPERTSSTACEFSRFDGVTVVSAARPRDTNGSVNRNVNVAHRMSISAGLVIMFPEEPWPDSVISNEPSHVVPDSTIELCVLRRIGEQVFVKLNATGFKYRDGRRPAKAEVSFFITF